MNISSYWILGRWCRFGFWTVNDDLLIFSINIREIDFCKFLVWFTLVHLLLNTSTTFHGILYILLKLYIGRLDLTDVEVLKMLQQSS